MNLLKSKTGIANRVKKKGTFVNKIVLKKKQNDLSFFQNNKNKICTWLTQKSLAYKIHCVPRGETSFSYKFSECASYVRAKIFHKHLAIL